MMTDSCRCYTLRCVCVCSRGSEVCGVPIWAKRFCSRASMWRSSVFVCIHLKNRPVPTRLSISLHLPVCVSLLLPLQPRPIPSVHLSFASSRLHSPLLYFLQPFILLLIASRSFSHLLTSCFPSLPYSLCHPLTLTQTLACSFTPTHSLLAYSHTSFTHTHTHTLSLSHCSLTEILPSVSSSYKSIVLSYIIRSALRQ